MRERLRLFPAAQPCQQGPAGGALGIPAATCLAVLGAARRQLHGRLAAHSIAKPPCCDLVLVAHIASGALQNAGWRRLTACAGLQPAL